MKNQLKILTAALLMTVALCSTQAFASVSGAANTAVVATQNIQVADAGYDMPQTDPAEDPDFGG
jgi:hypothetical protein